MQCFDVLCVPMIDFTTFKKHWLKPAPLPPPKGKKCRLFGVNLPFLKESRAYTGPVNQLIPTVRPTASCQNELSGWQLACIPVYLKCKGGILYLQNLTNNLTLQILATSKWPTRVYHGCSMKALLLIYVHSGWWWLRNPWNNMLFIILYIHVRAVHLWDWFQENIPLLISHNQM